MLPQSSAVPQDEAPASKVISIALTQKRPPPESPNHIRRRLYIILSFWAVVIFLGLPIWSWTTSIYRAKLPLREMSEWADGKACQLLFPLQIYVEAPNLQEQETQHLIRLTQHALDDLNDFTVHHLRLQLSPAGIALNDTATSGGASASSQGISDSGMDNKGDAALIVKLIPGESGSTPKATLEANSPTLTVYYTSNQVPSPSSTSGALSTFIAGQLQEIFAEEQAMLAYILATSSSNLSGIISGSNNGGQATSQNVQTSGGSNGRDSRMPALSKSLSPDVAADIARRLTRSAKYAPTYHLTFSLFTPTASPSSWDIESAIEVHLQPLLDSISPISNFTIDTQIQLYARFSPSVPDPEYNADTQQWTIHKDHLSGFINAAEWPLSPSIGTAPTLNFILYIPSPASTPLVIASTSGKTSWLIPQWGGVTILNPAPSSHLASSTLRTPLQTLISTQLLALLGAPRTPASLPLKLATLTRLRSATLLLSASSTLGALARLTLALPSIPIPVSVAANVDRTLVHLQRACAALRDGRFHAALENARVAEDAAEKAFFEKSMVGQVYFPDEHKVAVYLPLLGPVGVPLIIAVLKEAGRAWWEWRGRRRLGLGEAKGEEGR
ncbi:MAG: GPI transamidase component [Peltula sp. TS41687]|nr:MAG: GPI transamidase component [Peltula sp. TS41687]